MLRKFLKSLLLSTVVLGSLLQATQTPTPNASNGQVANAPRLAMGYLGVVTKYKSKEDGALIKIVKVNPASRGLTAYLNAIVFLDKSRIKLMAEKDVKVGDYIEFQIVTQQLLPNPYAPFAKPKEGSTSAQSGQAQGGATTQNNQMQTSTGQVNNQGGQMNASGTQTATGQTPPPLEFTINGDPKLGNQMVVSVPKIIPNGQTLLQAAG
ncbi:MAG: hypothetical protein ACRYGR_03045 [Janthinobacterium lividum]